MYGYHIYKRQTGKWSSVQDTSSVFQDAQPDFTGNRHEGDEVSHTHMVCIVWKKDVIDKIY